MFFQGKIWRRNSQKMITNLNSVPGISQSGIIVALSGGLDSVFLLLSLSQLQKKYHWRLFPTYVNHHYLNEDDFYGKIATLLAQKLNLPCSLLSARSCPPKTNLEDWMRRERYRLLEIERKKQKANFIAVAHHQSDQAETVLAHIIRGSGLHGLQGMSLLHRKIIRPLLDCPKEEITLLMHSTNFPYYNDKLNYCLNYQRNRLRQKFIPYLEKNFNPQITKKLAKLAKITRLTNI